MSAFRVIALPTEVAEAVRSEMRAPKYGHPAHRSLADGYGPCRHCLCTFDEGREDRILFTYDPFDQVEAPPLPGPVYIHAAPCHRYQEGSGFPEDLRSHRLTVVGYAQPRRQLEEIYIEDGKSEPVIEWLLANPKISYLHVRDTEAGCYDFRIERSAEIADARKVVKEFKC